MFGEPLVESVQGLLQGDSLIDRLLGDACELSTEFREFGVVGGFYVVVEAVVQKVVLGQLYDAHGELDYLDAGLEVDAVLAGGLEVQHQEVVEVALGLGFGKGLH